MFTAGFYALQVGNFGFSRRSKNPSILGKLFFFVILFVGISLYQIKHLITKKEIELSQIKNNIRNAQSDLNILKAELSYLKRPDRIEKIASVLLSLIGIVSVIDTFLFQFLSIGEQQNSLSLAYCASFILLSTQFPDILKKKHVVVPLYIMILQMLYSFSLRFF